MTKEKTKFDSETVYRLAQDLAGALCINDDYPAVIAAMLETLHTFDAGAMDVLKVFSAALLAMAKAQDAAAGAGAIVAIKLLALLMPGRDMGEVADAALEMLKTAARGGEETRHIRVVILRGGDG